MEPHPVPQNILDVEFKLFGAFTLKQFGKILAGCLIGVGIFLININIIIKVPLILISVFTGILLAIIPNFGVWLSGFLKALFISPRYVWVKTTETPEILQSKKVADPMKDRNVSSSLNKKKLDINELPLDKLFGTHTAPKTQEAQPDSPEGQNLERVYEDVFGSVTKGTRNQTVPSQAQANAMAGQVPAVPKTTNPQPNVTPSHDTVEGYQEEIQRLKYELSLIPKDNNYKQKEEEIMNKINDLYREIRLIGGKPSEIQKKGAMPKAEIMKSGLEGRVIYGIVVDKEDNPIANANIKLVNDAQKKVYNTTSSNDGKFSTVKPLPRGDYAVFIEASNKKFHAYKITIGDSDLPAYKLREK